MAIEITLHLRQLTQTAFLRSRKLPARLASESM
jgi:hypothetical protein